MYGCSSHQVTTVVDDDDDGWEKLAVSSSFHAATKGEGVDPGDLTAKEGVDQTVVFHIATSELLNQTRHI